MNLTAQSLDEEFLGRACITPPGTHCLLNQRIARFMPHKIPPVSLLWFFRGPIFRKQIEQRGTGTKVQHLYNSDLDSVLVALPKDRGELVTISRILDTAALLVRQEQSNLAKYELVRIGMHQDLLAGRVRVSEAEAVLEDL